MKVFSVMLSAVLFAITASFAAPNRDTVPDFWYVRQATDSPHVTGEAVRGIVVPTSVTPSIQTSPQGSIISWRRLDGTTQSFVVHGVSTLFLEKGPLAGTIYIPFHRPRPLLNADSQCCQCVTYENMSDSVEFLDCAPGCQGCTCASCICDPYPCPSRPEEGVRLEANNGVGPTITIGKGGPRGELAFENDRSLAARFSGQRLHAGIDARGVTTIENPDSITLNGAIQSRFSITEDKVRFAWLSPEASVILEQPVTMPEPVVADRTIALDPEPTASFRTFRPLELQVDRVRCSSCGTYPNHWADLERMECRSGGTTTCYRCVSWDC